MKNWYLLLISLMAALALFLILSLFYGRNTQKSLELDSPIRIILKSLDGEPMDFWDVVNRGIDEAAREFGVQVVVTGPRFEKEINDQIDIINRAIELSPPMLIVAATDFKKLVEPIKRANKLDIPVITVDSGVDSDIPVSFIATDNIEAGKKAGEEMKRLMEGNPRKELAIVSHIRETATAIDREAGVRAALEGMNIIGTWFCDVEQEKAYKISLELLKNENLGGIVALNEVSTLGVTKAIEELGLSDKVIAVGFDNAIQELSYLESGILKATVVQRPYNMGYLAVKTAVQYLSGESTTPFVDTGSILITRDNMFRREYQELLFPFGQ
ncbi:substrate-binding domain-containing protein [Spirochaeta isovalerica]|uniref:Ribose transport system substrate-binding protein n=1 Tax=Spirochaeta isovalerica TaxID=150 RepID=A0A841R9X7_9SPIO|nr:ribose transport system substrate-binding protein [Spirochaeta isovalerica]